MCIHVKKHISCYYKDRVMCLHLTTHGYRTCTCMIQHDHYSQIMIKSNVFLFENEDKKINKNQSRLEREDWLCYQTIVRINIRRVCE